VIQLRNNAKLTSGNRTIMTNSNDADQPTLLDDGTLSEIIKEAEDLKNVIDETEFEDHGTKPFTISSYGADYTVDSLVKRVGNKSFFVPPFQRSLVWNVKQASRFIESLLMGLPVPGIFVFREAQTNRHLIIDGQQRLTTLHSFYDGIFRKEEFRLVDVRKPWLDKTYKELDSHDKLRLDDSVIHTTIFRQEEPENNTDSIYEVFERINSGGIKLSDQEIRVAVNFGPFTNLLKDLNDNPEWRGLYGTQSVRLKDQELILRFLALSYELAIYARPMRIFLNRFMEKNKNIKLDKAQGYTSKFTTAIDFISTTLGRKAFRPERSLNTAVFDATMVGLSERLDIGPITDTPGFIAAYDKLLADEDFKDAYTRSTADEEKVKLRISLAKSVFANLK
jgi:hypothetical protein